MWIGVDVGKEIYWAWALDSEGTRLLSRRVANDESDLLSLIVEMAKLDAEQITWAVDLTTVEATLVLATSWGHGQRCDTCQAQR